MARLPRLFIHEVNIAILAVVVLTLLAGGAHYLSTLRELQRVREELCAARLEVVASRHPYLQKSALDSADKCGALAILTGDAPRSPRPRRPSLNM